MSRLFAVPDIHGHLELLLKLLDTLTTLYKLDLTTDKIIFLGDMIDRGPNSKGVLDKVRELTLLHPDNVIALAGNHEYLCIAAHIGTEADEKFWHKHGGKQTMLSFGASHMPFEYIDWIASLPHQHEEPGFFFSHAPAPCESIRKEINKGQPLTKGELLWTGGGDNEINVARVHDNGVIGVCGHVNALRKGLMVPRFYSHYIFADAGVGCSSKSPLVAIEVTEGKTIYAWP